VAVTTGCRPLVLPDYPSRPIDAARFVAVLDEIAVAVHPITDPAESDRYFGVNLLQSGILALCVTIENRSRETIVLIDPADIMLAQAGTARTSGPHGQGLRAAGTVAVGVGATGLGAALLFPPAIVAAAPLVLVGAKASSDAKAISYNAELKQLRATTLAPGDRAQGFIYYGLPDGFLWRDLSLQTTMIDPIARRPFIVEVPFEASASR
jgi:hypothetical protein